MHNYLNFRSSILWEQKRGAYLGRIQTLISIPWNFCDCV
uniref:Uncharacterized protein n=1 Tax=Arundo donax TaxID=35708 RepID=A0A0A9H8L4_ARUDO